MSLDKTDDGLVCQNKNYSFDELCIDKERPSAPCILKTGITVNL